MTQVVRKENHVLTVVSGQVVVANGNSDAIAIPDAPNAWWFILDVTVDDFTTLDVHVETLYDGTNFGEIVAFEQQTTVAKTSEKVGLGLNQAGFDPSAALGAGNANDVMGDTIRASWVITGTSATFSVFAIPM